MLLIFKKDKRRGTRKKVRRKWRQCKHTHQFARQGTASSTVSSKNEQQTSESWEESVSQLVIPTCNTCQFPSWKIACFSTNISKLISISFWLFHVFIPCYDLIIMSKPILIALLFILIFLKSWLVMWSFFCPYNELSSEFSLLYPLFYIVYHLIFDADILLLFTILSKSFNMRNFILACNKRCLLNTIPLMLSYL